MAEYHHRGHSVTDLKYHLIWVTKYRFAVLKGDVATFAHDVSVSQQIAMKKHPDLAVAGSTFNQRFLARYQQWKDRHDPRLDKSDWPERLADACAVER